MFEVLVGATDVTIYVYFVDDDGGTAPGEPTTGLAFGDIETGGSASTMRQGAARADLTLVTQTVAGAHTDGGFIEVDATNMPGVYRLDLPDVFASGADFVIAMCVAASGNNSIMRPVVVRIRKPILPQKNVALDNIPFEMVLSSDHTTAATGLTVIATRSIDGGTTYSATTGTVTEAESGTYHFDASAADMNGDIVTFKFSVATADDTKVSIRTEG